MGIKSLTPSRVLFFLTLLTITTQAFSRDQYDWTLFGVRPLGMGNAFVAVADDFNALYYNPAGLARLKDWKMELINPKFDISSNTYFLFKRTQSEGNMDLAEVLEKIDEEAGKPHHIGFGIRPYYVRPGWGFSIGSETFASFITSSNGPEIETMAMTRFQVPFSHARNFLKDQLSVGLTVKLNAIAALDKDINIDTVGLLITEDGEEKPDLSDYLATGLGIGFDMGVLFTPSNTPLEPTFGLSITDFGGSKWRKIRADADKVKFLPPAINTGMSIKPYRGENSYLLFAVDTHTINRDSHFSKKISFGLEWGYSDIIKFQTGFYHGQITGGMEFDVPFFTLRLATYGVDRSPIVGKEKNLVDRRVVVQIKLLI